MGTPTSWLIGDAPDGRLLGTLTFGQLFGCALGFWLVGTLEVVGGAGKLRVSKG